MKNLLQNSFLLGCILLVNACAPKYTASFEYHPRNLTDEEHLVSTDEEVNNAIDKLKKGDVLPEVPKEEYLVSTSETSLTTSVKRNPIEEIIKAHEPKIEQINNSGLKGRALKRALKAEQKSIKKEIKEEIKEAKKAGDDEYIVMMILAFIIPFLGVGLTYGITKEFWISLILTLIFWLPGAIYSLIKVHEYFKG